MKTTKHFYVTNLKKARKYGFRPSRNGDYWWKYGDTVGMIIEHETNRIVMLSASSSAIEVLCKMYKDDLLFIIDVTREIRFAPTIIIKDCK